MATLIGQTKGGYLIEKEIGRGAMGVVFKAKQISMERDVALKFLPKRLAQDEKTVARFLREARAAGQLSHPNIVGVHDTGVVEGLHYIAMEFVDGNSVQKHIKDHGPFGEKEALEIGEHIAEALKYAHGKGILHRDIKPDNFLMGKDGRVRLADLGLARHQNKADAELTQDGEAMGTPHYMSPEQCKGTDVDARSDLYSLGASMFMIASGQTPYEANTAAAVMVKVLTEPPRSLKKINPALSAGFVAMVERMMAKDPAKRFQDAGQVIDVIQKVKHGTYKTPLVRIGTGPAAPVAPPPSPKLKLVAYGAGMAVLALIAIFMVWKPKTEAAKAPAPSPSTTTTAAATEQNPPAVVLNKPPGPGDSPKTDPAAPKSTQPPSTLQNNDNVVDMKPEHMKAVKALSALKLDLEEKLQSNPDHVIEQLQNFAKMHPNPRIADNALNSPLMKRAKEAKEKLEKDWTVAKETAEQEAAEGHKDKAFRALWKFVENHEETKQAAEAVGMMRGMLTDIRRQATVLAEKGNFERAEEILTGATNKLPSEISDTLKKDLEKIQNEHKRAIAFADADAKLLASLHEKAQATVNAIDAPGGRRYYFEDGAKVVQDGMSQFQTEQGKKDAKALIENYTKAAEVVFQMQTKTNASKAVELQGLGKYPAGQLQSWGDKELTYKPANAAGLPPQPVPFKLVTAENLLQIAQALGLSTKDAPDHLSMGTLAFAAGAKDIALEHLQKAETGTTTKSMVDVALRFLRGASATPVATGNRNDQAKQLYTEALAARQKKDMDAVIKFQQTLVREFADTDFVKDNIKQVGQLGVAGSSELDPVVAHKEKLPDKTPDKTEPKKDPLPDKTDKKDDPVVAELKKLGWAEVKGDWVQDKNRRENYAVTGGGQLVSPASDGIVQLRFQLEEGASLQVYFRNEAIDTVPKSTRDNLWEYDFILGAGYGVVVDAVSVTTFGDISPNAFSPGTAKAKWSKVPLPLKVDKRNIKNELHALQIMVRGEHLEISLDGKSLTKSTDNLRPTGNIVLNVEGNAKLESPTLIK